MKFLHHDAASFRPGRKAIALGVASLLALVANGARAASVTAQVDPPIIHMGESARFSLTFTDVPQSALRFYKLPEVKGLRFLYQGQSTSMQMTNGQTSLSVSYNYVVTPEQEGKFTIPAIEVPISSQRLHTQPVELTVLPPGKPIPGEKTHPRWAYLVLMPHKEEVYVGERLPVELTLYIVNGQNYVPRPLNNPGFVFGKLEMGGQSQVRRHNTLYHVVRHFQNAFPTKAGTLTLGPAQASVTLLIPRQGGNDPFGGLFRFDPFGIQAEARPVELRSEAKTIQVKPLPAEGRPSGFTGAVGQYQMEVAVAPTNVAVGEPVHLKIRIQGQGLLDNVTLPTGDGWDGFKVYPPRTKIDVTDSLRAIGVKTFEQDIVPQRVDLKEIPPIHFSFFDPQQGRYRTLTHPAQPLLVRPVSRTQALAPLPSANGDQTAENPAVSQELVPLKERLGPLALIRPPLITRPWFWAVLLAPALACGAAWGWRRRADHLARNPRLARQLAFGRVRRRMVAELNELARQGDATAFFAHAFRLLQAQLGERLDLPEAAITEAVLDERLRPAGAPEPVVKDLHELFQICNQARYARVVESKDLPGMARRIKTVLDRVRQLDL